MIKQPFHVEPSISDDRKIEDDNCRELLKQEQERVDILERRMEDYRSALQTKEELLVCTQTNLERMQDHCEFLENEIKCHRGDAILTKFIDESEFAEKENRTETVINRLLGLVRSRSHFVKLSNGMYKFGEMKVSLKPSQNDQILIVTFGACGEVLPIDEFINQFEQQTININRLKC
eukprot:GHVL01013093.1.p1 GENE.GHVL01013093.1~~GHVL01013093.1.p1  ORF type:complete len:177 (-),score=29.51 GHVL01013093.1:166-696(-)